jgi:hypothetical protein
VAILGLFAEVSGLPPGETLTLQPVRRRTATVIEPQVVGALPAPPSEKRLRERPSGAGLPNILVNNPAGEAPFDGNTQMEPSIAASGDTVVCAFTDSRGFYGTGTLSGYAVSFDGGATWDDRGSLPRAAIRDQVYGDATLVTDGAGTWYCVSVYDIGNGVGGNPGDLGLVLHTGHFNGSMLVWTGPRLIAGGGSGAALDGPHAAIDPESDRIYVTYANVGMGFAWGQIEVLTIGSHGAVNLHTTIVQPRAIGTNNTGPRLAVGPEGVVYCAWESGHLTNNGQGPAFQKVARSLDQGLTFDAPVTAATVFESWFSGPPGFNREEEFVEYPSLAVDRSNGPNRGRVYLAWHDAVWRNYDQTILLVAEAPDNNDSPQTAQILPAGEGQWQIDGTLTDDDFVDWYRFAGHAGEHLRFILRPNAFMQLSTRLYWAPTGAINDIILAGSERHNGDPVFFMFTLPTDGDYWIRIVRQTYSGTYTGYLRKTTSTDPSTAIDHRDVVLVSSPDGVSGWTPKVRVNDDTGYTDQSFPEVVVDGDGGVHVSWYDRRFDEQARALADVMLATSNDGGLTFAPNLRLTETSSFWQVPADAVPNFGDGFRPLAVGDRLFPVWADGRLGSPDIMVSPLRTGFGTTHPAVLRADVGRPLGLVVTVRNDTPYDDARFAVHIGSGVPLLSDSTLVVGPVPSGESRAVVYAPIVGPGMLPLTLDLQVLCDRSAHVYVGQVVVFNDPVAVHLADFAANDIEGATRLEWRAGGGSVFHVERGAAAEGPFELLTAQPVGPGSDGRYTYVDRTRPRSSKAWYRLMAIESGARWTPFGPFAVEAGAPRALALLGARPNPFNPSTTILFELPRSAPVTLRVHDVRGRVVATLLDGAVRDAGQHAVFWDGHDTTGATIASGVYVAELQALGMRRTSRLVVLR